MSRVTGTARVILGYTFQVTHWQKYIPGYPEISRDILFGKSYPEDIPEYHDPWIYFYSHGSIRVPGPVYVGISQDMSGYEICYVGIC